MPRLLKIAVVAGLVAGLLVGGFHSLFTVPVIERAMALEEERAAAEAGAPAAGGKDAPLVSLGVQRIGMAVGTVIYGAILGLVFAAGYTLLLRAVPHWQPPYLAMAVGALGFWSISLFPFIKYPLNPPGVGDEGTLLSRQLFQTMFFILSAAGVAGLLLGVRRVNSAAAEISQRMRLYAIVFLAYGAFALIMVFAFPGNPDPVPVPVDLLELFRVLTMVGQFLLWALLAAGVALTLTWYGRSAQATIGGQPPAAGGQGPEP
jgi:predicted cobalt transporter CbtA